MKFYKKRKFINPKKWNHKKDRVPRKLKKKLKKEDAKYIDKGFFLKRMSSIEVLKTRCRAYKYRF